MKSINLYAALLIFFIAGFQIQAQDMSQYFAKNTIQVGVVTENLDKALDFYINALGMVKHSEFSVDGEFGTKSGLTDGLPIDVTVLKLENSDDAQSWKVMSFGKKAKHPKQKYISDDTGMQYTTIYVKNMKPFIERLKKHTVKFLGETPIMLDTERQFVLVQDPDGNFIELIGPK